jgi:protein TonB
MNQKHRWLRRLPAVAGVLLSLAVAVAVYLLQDRVHKAPQPKKVVQQVVMVQPPPPPPPPPPEQQPPEPEPEEQKVEEPEPEQEPEPAPEEAEQPPGEELGVDAEGGAGSDAFGLVGRKGGRSLLGGTAGSAILWYGGQVKRHLEDELRDLLADTEARRSSYAVVVDVWIGPDGRIGRAELAGGSGRPEVDRAIQGALPRLRFALSKPPPDHMPQPVKIRLTSRL